MNYQDKFDKMMERGNVATQSERTAESLIAFETALAPLYRAKEHKPAPVSDEDRKYAMSAREAEQARLITERIRRNGGEV